MMKSLISNASDDSRTVRGGFRPIGKSSPSELFRNRPSQDESYVECTDGDGFACYVRIEAIRQMSSFGLAAGPREIMGRLGGRRCQDSQGSYVLVERAVLTRGARGSPGAVQADIPAQHVVSMEFEAKCRPFDSVGWWHTHLPEVGLFFSSVDRENQSLWRDPTSIGIVVHPGLTGEGLKVFRGPKSTELDLQVPSETLRRHCHPQQSSIPVRHDASERSPAGKEVLQDRTATSSQPRTENRPRRMLGTTLGLASAAIALSLVSLVIAGASFYLTLKIVTDMAP